MCCERGGCGEATTRALDTTFAGYSRPNAGDRSRVGARDRLFRGEPTAVTADRAASAANRAWTRADTVTSDVAREWLARRERTRRRIAALAVIALLALAVRGRGGRRRPSDGDLSPRLAELAKPSRAARRRRPSRRGLSLAAEGPGSLLRDGNRVLVEVRFDHGAAAGVDDLRAAGAKIVNVSRRYQTVTVAAKPASSARSPRCRGVAGATEVLTPITPPASTCPPALVVSEGDAQLDAAEAREATSASTAAASPSGSSPTPSTSRPEPSAATRSRRSRRRRQRRPARARQPLRPDDARSTSSTTPSTRRSEDEGRAMAQIVHDLAPGARLAFATAFTRRSSASPKTSKRWPTAPGAEPVIADDVSYFEEPFFQDGPVAVAVDEVADEGRHLLLRGRQRQPDRRRTARTSPPGKRRNSATPAAARRRSEAIAAPEPEPLHGLQPGRQATTEPSGSPSNEGETLTRRPAVGGTLVRGRHRPRCLPARRRAAKLRRRQAREDNVGATARRSRSRSSAGKTTSGDRSRTVQLVDQPLQRARRARRAQVRAAGERRRRDAQPSTRESVRRRRRRPDDLRPQRRRRRDRRRRGAASTPARRRSPTPRAGRSPTTSARSQGPTPAAPTRLARDDRQARPRGDRLRPDDLLRPDCDAGIWRFCGTSAAAPHAAAVAALMRQANPSLTPAQFAHGAGRDRAARSAPSAPDAVGAGLVDAYGAVGERRPAAEGHDHRSRRRR